MQHHDATLPVQYIRQIADLIRGLGADVPRWLARSGLDETKLADASLTITFPTFTNLVVDAVTLAREPALGLLVGERLLANSHGILGYAAMNADTIRHALALLERFMPLRISLVAITHSLHPGELRVAFTETEPLGAIRVPVLEAVVMSIKNVLDSLTMGAIPVQTVAFAFDAPGHAGLARDLFRCDVRYAQGWTGFTLEPEVLDVPLKMADPAAFEEAARICQRELDKLRANASLAARVRRLLLEKQNGFPSLEVTARLFHMTPRTLHRRLLDEGTSFRTLLEEVRHTLAIEHLKAQRFSVEEIAYTLGYTDLANFRRAFKRWEGVPPSAFRANASQTIPRA